MLKDKVVLITGVNRGLGKALASAFITEQCTVIGIARNASSLAELTAELNCPRFHPFGADVSSASEIDATIQKIITTHERIDIVFNNAAVYPRNNFLKESAVEFASAININICGIANLCKSVIPGMIAQGYGRIYNLGSFADLSPIPCSAAYSASKGAVHALTTAIAADINNLNLDIHVHEWIPGHLNTDMGTAEGIDPNISAHWAVQIASDQISPSSNCVLFVNDAELAPARSLKQRIKSKLLFWRKH